MTSRAEDDDVTRLCKILLFESWNVVSPVYGICFNRINILYPKRSQIYLSPLVLCKNSHLQVSQAFPTYNNPYSLSIPIVIKYLKDTEIAPLSH